METEKVVVVAYDPAWPAQFGALRDRIATVLGDLAAGIEHVGSTAVPGLDAVPTLDIDVVFRRAADLPAVVDRLALLGYRHLGDLGVVGREAFAAAADQPAHHLFACPAGGAALQAHLILRDALRADPELAAAYAALKRDLAVRCGADRDSYTEGKTAFITAVLLDARGRAQRFARRK